MARHPGQIRQKFLKSPVYELLIIIFNNKNKNNTGRGAGLDSRSLLLLNRSFSRSLLTLMRTSKQQYRARSWTRRRRRCPSRRSSRSAAREKAPPMSALRTGRRYISYI